MDSYTTRKRAFLNALLFSMMFFVISYLLGFCWESNDDPAIAQILSNRFNNFSPYQWRFISRVIHRLYMHFPVVDWWAVCTVFACWISAFVYTYVTYRRYPLKMALLISIMLLLVLWLVACNKLNFTRTAAAVSTAGILLIANGLFPAQKAKFSWIEYFFGLALLLYGASIRRNCALFALAFLAVIGLVQLLGDKFSFRWSWIRGHFRQIVLLCMAAAVYFGAFALNKAQRTPEQQAFIEYNNLRASIIDWGGNYPKYHEAEEEYLDAGWNEVGQKSFFNWLSEDTNVFNMESMKKVSKLYKPNEMVTLSTDAIEASQSLAFLVVMVALLLCYYKKNNWIYGLASCGMLVALCIYLMVQGRFPTRVFQSLLLVAVCAVVFLCGNKVIDDVLPQESACPAVNLFYTKRISSILLVTGFVLNVFVGIALVKTSYVETKDARDFTEQQSLAEEERELLDLIDADSTHIYIFDILTNPASMTRAFPFFGARSMDYCENLFSLGGWDARLPHNVTMLNSYGISNPMIALFERTNVYSTYSGRLLEYLHAYYNPCITASGTEMLGEAQLVQYTKPIDDALIISDQTHMAMLNKCYRDVINGYDVYYFHATINDSANYERVFYCNITVNGNRYTYRLKCEDNKVFGLLYGMNQIESLDSAEIRIFEKVENTYVEYTWIR